MTNTAAPPLQVGQWFNQDQALTLAELRGKVVVLHAFQMLIDHTGQLVLHEFGVVDDLRLGALIGNLLD